jgi:hypothetical protein
VQHWRNDITFAIKSSKLCKIYFFLAGKTIVYANKLDGYWGSGIDNRVSALLSPKISMSKSVGYITDAVV